MKRGDTDSNGEGVTTTELGGTAGLLLAGGVGFDGEDVAKDAGKDAGKEVAKEATGVELGLEIRQCQFIHFA